MDKWPFGVKSSLCNERVNGLEFFVRSQGFSICCPTLCVLYHIPHQIRQMGEKFAQGPRNNDDDDDDCISDDGTDE